MQCETISQISIIFLRKKSSNTQTIVLYIETYYPDTHHKHIIDKKSQNSLRFWVKKVISREYSI